MKPTGPVHIKIDVTDQRPSDLGGGAKLEFQKLKADPAKFRAIIKTATGEIWSKSDLFNTPDKSLWARMQAISRGKQRTFNATLGLGPNATKQEIEKAFLTNAKSMFGFGGFPK